MLTSDAGLATPFTRECSTQGETSETLVPMDQGCRHSSAGEHRFHTAGVTGSIPVACTKATIAARLFGGDHG